MKLNKDLLLNFYKQIIDISEFDFYKAALCLSKPSRVEQSYDVAAVSKCLRYLISFRGLIFLTIDHKVPIIMHLRVTKYFSKIQTRLSKQVNYFSIFFFQFLNVYRTTWIRTNFPRCVKGCIVGKMTKTQIIGCKKILVLKEFITLTSQTPCSVVFTGTAFFTVL